MKITNEILQKYAHLIACTGANVQKGQIVQLLAEVDQHEFAMMIMEECYKAGAAKVNMEWTCEKESRLNYQYADEEVLSRILPWEEAKLQQGVKDLPVHIYVDSSDPDAMAGIDPSKLSSVMQKRAKIIKPYRNASDGKFQWLIVSVPSPKWAMKCFPEVSEEEAMDKLWDAIFKTIRISEDNDPDQEWADHCKLLTTKAAWLDSQHFEKLQYKSANGTDFEVTLIPEARWDGAGCTNPVNGVFYIPNMPTEEIFTTPWAGKCEGTLVSTKPLSWNSQLIENFSITFKNGKAVSWKAERGQEVLDQMIRMDENACMLGECALVPKESPVNQCGFLFYNTLFDENACCHFALGMGFKEVLPDADNMTVQEAAEKGVNDCSIHVDFMVGSDDLSIVGIKPDGERVPIFVNGTWA